MTDAQLLPLLEKHLGLRARRDDTVINPTTGHFTDLQRYRDLAVELCARAVHEAQVKALCEEVRQHVAHVEELASICRALIKNERPA